MQREMMAARHRRGGERDDWGRDLLDGRRDGSECSPGPDDRDLPPSRQMLSGGGRGGWMGAPPGRGRGGGPGFVDRPPRGRPRPSMFARRDTDSPPRR